VTELLKAIGSVNSVWSMAAFTIVAVLLFLSMVLRKSGGKSRRTDASSRVIWLGAAVICLLGLAPILANSFVEAQRLKTAAIYRVRITALDEAGAPISGVQLHVTASNETAETKTGETELSIPRGTVPADGKVTIFVEKTSGFLRGSNEIQLGADPNPSVIIHLKRDASASVAGLVEDELGRGIADAVVSIPGAGDTKTSENGSFSLSAHAAPGQPVTLHVDKPGYQPVDQSHLAGSEPATIVLAHDGRERR
jgi:hypothetical protein